MFTQSTIPVRDILRDYKKVFDRVKKSGKGVVVIRDNIPQVAIISLEEYEKIQLDNLRNDAIKEYNEGKTRSIDTKEDLENYFNEAEST
ncbi:hypothetical protein A3A93_05535 [Candidatus Roizmanbacteria bacterium RIFCSPLOWO2_01_FULL_38_12]|uniref:Antitoxin n=1 Tax=Candidatus Roizmanbacteria bacterium RIFCSPLOWO2_01_FULL_38_12 TaxID=1802061 RepID=A0A1F7IZ76_9BACT|nr:MAG: hypothetical protein A3F59_06270 [Candidatus Roizmanbacteria bacterium RIFCSPHIGHO2_12_FULL_38_13]OGK48649.1 MAG: hypothetical protein A3A93_05535 [Candidatus Roizmanbacteria bacterium RIFCSPLOWO2_01_FULL_38_12]